MEIETVEGFTTEGVLIIVNITKCQEYYSDKEFNYAYPEGLSDLLLKGIVHIITTDEDVEEINFVFDKEEIDVNEWQYKEAYNYLKVEEDDEIRLISHADFTQICDEWGKGDNPNKEYNELLEFMKEHKIENSENKLTLESFTEGRIKRRKEKEEKIWNELPKIGLEAGLYKVNVYAKVFASGYFPEFTFHFEAINAVDLDKITLKPIEFYSE